MNVIIVVILLQTATGGNMGGLVQFHSILRSPPNAFTAVHSASVPGERYTPFLPQYCYPGLFMQGISYMHTAHTHTTHTHPLPSTHTHNAQEDPGPGCYELRPQRTKSAPSRFPFNSSAKTQTLFNGSTVSLIKVGCIYSVS